MKLPKIFTHRKETEKETARRLFKLTNRKDYGIFAAPMEAQTAVIELAHHLLGEDWASPNPISIEQINTEIVFAIERKYNVKRVPKSRH